MKKKSGREPAKYCENCKMYVDNGQEKPAVFCPNCNGILTVPKSWKSVNGN